MTERFDLAFSFKGDRDYIHGTDMMDAVTKVLRQKFTVPVHGLDFQIHRMSGLNLALILNQETSPEAGDPVATLRLDAGGICWHGKLLESATPPQERHPYDEALLASGCEFTHENGMAAIFLSSAPGYTQIETFVAMTKAMHLQTFPDAKDKWVFCRWSSAIWPVEEPLRDISITLVRALGTRLTRSEVAVQGRPVGTVYFSAKEQGK